MWTCGEESVVSLTLPSFIWSGDMDVPICSGIAC